LCRFSYIYIYAGTSSGGVWVVDRAADKIDYVHDRIVVLRSGEASSSQQAAHKVRYLIDSHSVEQNKLPHVRTAAKMFQKLNYEKQLGCGFIVAGWDPYEGAQIFSVNLGGATL
jgi:20S proteasome subunit beta 1